MRIVEDESNCSYSGKDFKNYPYDSNNFTISHGLGVVFDSSQINDNFIDFTQKDYYYDDTHRIQHAFI